MKKHDTIPPAFFAFCHEQNFMDSSGHGYAVRCAVAELFGVRPDLIRIWLKSSSTSVPCPTMAKIKALLYAVGKMPLPTKIVQVFEVMVGFGLPPYDKVNETLGYSSQGNVVLLDILRGAPMRGPQQKALNEFVADNRGELEKRKAAWLRALADAGFDLASLPKPAPAADPGPQVHILPQIPVAEVPSAEKTEEKAVPVETVVSSCVAMISGLLPLLRYLDTHGTDENFRELRQRLALPNGGNGVFTVKNLLASMSSDEARRTTKHGGKSKW